MTTQHSSKKLVLICVSKIQHENSIVSLADKEQTTPYFYPNLANGNEWKLQHSSSSLSWRHQGSQAASLAGTRII